jgi:hypothetical protein
MEINEDGEITDDITNPKAPKRKHNDDSQDYENNDLNMKTMVAPILIKNVILIYNSWKKKGLMTKLLLTKNLVKSAMHK